MDAHDDDGRGIARPGCASAAEFRVANRPAMALDSVSADGRVPASS
ncbi:hypothetical protein [Quadrisphaera granulorum]|nr:hypothetical protein [Quadrisphaera granulorum]